MAVYTKLSNEQIANLLAQYGVTGSFSARGIEEGIENSNYLIEADKKYILTIFEKRVNAEDLPFFFALTDHLNKKGIKCPVLIGNKLADVDGKKAALVSFLEGSGVKNPEAWHAEKLGEFVARMHLAVADFKQSRTNQMGLRTWTKLFEKIGTKGDELENGLTKLIADEIYYQANSWPIGLPAGAVHTDIFPDNLFFKDKEISGVIDFYFACTDSFVYDIAIILNGWGYQDEFLKSYESVRKLSAEEKAALPNMLRAAALRILMTRLHDWFFTPADAVVKKKDPMEYVKKLKALRA